MAAGTRIEYLGAQRGDLGLLQALGVDQQRAQLGRAQLLDPILGPLRNSAARQDAYVGFHAHSSETKKPGNPGLFFSRPPAYASLRLAARRPIGLCSISN